MLHLLKTIANLTSKFLNKPLNYIGSIGGIIRGTFYIWYFRLFRQNVRIGFPFIAFAPVRIIGPGSVSIGRNCSVFKNVFRGLTIITLSKNAKVTIGKECHLGGLTIRCSNHIEIGDRAMTAVSLIQDSLFVDLNKANSIINNQQIVAPKPVKVGDNAWLSGYSIVLENSKIGKDCVLGVCSLYYNIELNEYSLGLGNPVKRAFPIDRILNLKGVS